MWSRTDPSYGEGMRRSPPCAGADSDVQSREPGTAHDVSGPDDDED
jgi:hypothetical protein